MSPEETQEESVKSEESKNTILLHEHSELLDEIIHRRRNTWLIISIVLAGTFLISFSETSIPVFYRHALSIFLVAWSWALWETAGIVNNECWEDRHEIEDDLEIERNKKRKNRLDTNIFHKYIRKRLWRTLFGSLVVLYFFLLTITLPSYTIQIQNLGLGLEFVGGLVILLAQIAVILKLYSKYQSRTFLKRAFLELTTPQIGPNEKDLREKNNKEINEQFKKYHLAGWVYDDFIISILGLCTMLVGVFLQLP